MESEEMIRLRELREQLLKNAFELRNKLKDQEENGRQSSITFNITLPSHDEDKSSETLLSAKYEAKLCEISGQVTGITFRDVSKKWLRDNVYLYVAKVVTKMISFSLELTIFLTDLDDFKIDDIMCYFISTDDCLMQEVSPWFQKITRTKNFSLLMSAISNYNEYGILRSKILHSLESKKYAKVEQCTEENGGVLVHMCSPADTSKSYIIFQWTLKFLDLTWHIEHFFTVKTTDVGTEFTDENRALLKEFCKIGLTRDNLVELWETLCVAIDSYAKSTETTLTEQ